MAQSTSSGTSRHPIWPHRICARTREWGLGDAATWRDKKGAATDALLSGFEHDQKLRVQPIEAESWLMFKSTVPPVGPNGVISGPETVFFGT